jgi:hypothetical protein
MVPAVPATKTVPDVSAVPVVPIVRHGDTPINFGAGTEHRLARLDRAAFVDLALERSKPNHVTVHNPIRRTSTFRNSENVEMSSSIGHERMRESFDLRFGKSFWMISQTISTSTLK